MNGDLVRILSRRSLTTGKRQSGYSMSRSRIEHVTITRKIQVQNLTATKIGRL
jgi:hypothetical protein